VNVLERLVGEHRAVTSGLASPAPWLIDAVDRRDVQRPERVSAEKALSLTPFRSAVTLIAETIGLLPFKVYRDLGDGAKVSARDHRAWRMLHDKPNPVTTAHRFWSTVATHLLVWGNAYIEKLRDESGLVTELWLRDPTQMAVEWNDVSKRRRFFEDTATGRKFWTDEQILHIPGWSVNGLTGESMVYRGRQTIGNAIAREEFEGSFYRRGAVLSLVIKHPGTLKPARGRPAQRHVLGALRRLGNAHGTPVLEEGATLEKVSPTLQELQFEEAQQRSRTEIAVMFRLPPAFLGGTTGDSLTYATVESNMIQFAQHTIQPYTTMIESAVAADTGIFPFQSWFPEFVLDGLLRADSNARAQFYRALTACGAIVPNEIRDRENMPPRDGGDEPLKAATSVAPSLDAGGDPLADNQATA
jgi:HK97 family phage portal protein